MAASVILNVIMVLTLVDASTNTWLSALSGGRGDATNAIVGGGTKDIAGTLNKLALVTSDTLDLGKVNVLWE